MPRKSKAYGIIKAWDVTRNYLDAGTVEQPQKQIYVGSRTDITIQLDYGIDATMQDLDKAAKKAISTWIKEKS